MVHSSKCCRYCLLVDVRMNLHLVQIYIRLNPASICLLLHITFVLLGSDYHEASYITVVYS